MITLTKVSVALLGLSFLMPMQDSVRRDGAAVEKGAALAGVEGEGQGSGDRLSGRVQGSLHGAVDPRSEEYVSALPRALIEHDTFGVSQPGERGDDAGDSSYMAVTNQELQRLNATAMTSIRHGDGVLRASLSSEVYVDLGRSITALEVDLVQGYVVPLPAALTTEDGPAWRLR